jgi:uncharacterized repeat protein (TIGR03803 family)
MTPLHVNITQQQNRGRFQKFGMFLVALLARCSIAGLFLLAAATGSATTTFKTLVNFNGQNGSNPLRESLVQGTDGNLYGTTEEGGTFGFGSVFKLTPGGTLTTIYNFTNTPDGAYPRGGLVLGSSGVFFWGTTSQGGANGLGTFFKITAVGTLTIVHSFNGADGEFPPNPCVQGTDGNFYGVTEGAINAPGIHIYGTIFKITPAGTLTTLHNFCTQADCPDGAYPIGALVQGSDGTFYGTTNQGGANNLGTVFSVTSGGTLTTLHSFIGTDGANPQAQPTQEPSLNFYGTTVTGGASNLGTVFKITSGGTLTTLHSFNGTDGQYPAGELVKATDGNLYGTTTGAINAPGIHILGTIFKITPAGVVTTLHNFCSQTGCPDGSYPYGSLVQRTTGTFFGVTSAGGSSGLGTAFSLSAGLGAFVETLPTSGAVGAAVIILGTNLAGATSVTFDGVAAAFKVVSSSEITTTVPSGATIGPVVVVRPSGTLTSNVNFVVP